MSTDGMIPTADGRHAICINEADPFYGWAFVKHPDGQWVSLRKATEEELYTAKVCHAQKEFVDGGGAFIASPVSNGTWNACPFCKELVDLPGGEVNTPETRFDCSNCRTPLIAETFETVGWALVLDDERVNDEREQRSSPVHEEPSPKLSDGLALWDLVIADFRCSDYEVRFPTIARHVVADMQERDRIGRERYGMPLRANNGRRPLVDAYQELLDMVVYLRQAIEEHPDKDLVVGMWSGWSLSELQRVYRTALSMVVRLAQFVPR